MAPPCAVLGGGRFDGRGGSPVLLWLRLPGGTGGGVPNRVGKGQKVVRPRLLWRGGQGKAHDFPTAGDGQRVGMLGAQIVTMRFSVGGQRSQDGRGVCIDIRQGGYR